jgi:uncharacterized protein YgiM (DUF1202 family)
VQLADDAVWYSGKTISKWVKDQLWIVLSVSGDRVVIDKSTNGKYSVCSPVAEKYLKLIERPFAPYKVKITASLLNYRQEPNNDSKINGTIKKNGVYTIIEEKNGWGKLKSGAGWINLSYTTKV